MKHFFPGEFYEAYAYIYVQSFFALKLTGKKIYNLFVILLERLLNEVFLSSIVYTLLK